MNTSVYIALFILLFIVIYSGKRDEKIILKQIKKMKNKEERAEMTELAKRFIGKECVISTFNSQVVGVIKEVTDGAVLIENNENLEIINIDYIVKIKEYPRNKNGKKKIIVG